MRSKELRHELPRPSLRQIVDSLFGAVLCAVAAAGVSAVSVGHRWEAWAPLLFVVVLLLTAAFFGASAGIAGTVLAGIIFSIFMFKLPGSIHIGNELERSNLAWMLLLGISFAFLFAPTGSSFRRR